MKSGPQLFLRCEWCHEFFKYNGGKRKRWCGDAHRQAAWRAANQDHSESLSAAQFAVGAQRFAQAVAAGGVSAGPRNK